MSGYLMGTDAFFRVNGYGGTESHFGVGGAYDRNDLDGTVIQWQSIDRQADAQFAGNAYATSVETSDGAHDGVAWSPKQLESIIRLGVWWCQQTGNPARLITAPDQKGFGYHSQFHIWNKNDHDCPGSVRLAQYKNEVIPEIANRLHSEPVIRVLRLISPLMHGHDVEKAQQQLNQHGAKLKVDGVYGSMTEKAVRHFQTTHHLSVDGMVGKDTRAALMK
jgi:hypothetical protein